jgi:CRISPR/Cas system-associated exonuclease Cas4 (RecB family)
MTYFLDRIATHLFKEFGDRLDRHCLVFPNRRAGLYFLKYLAGKAGKPIWSPDVKTINELFQLFSLTRLAESELLVFELFKVYRELNKNAGNIDDFFFWGEMLLNDFDDVDKYLIDASKLFVNLKEIKEIDTEFGGLTEAQIEIIKQFWINFNPAASTDQKSDFQEIWSILLPLYYRFRYSLIERGIAYEGMIYRELAEKCIAGNMPQVKWDYLHFIGFNALNNCEKELMTRLKKSSHARFYWDYDDSFVTENPGHSAGFFVRENLKLLGNDMPADWNYNSASGKKANPSRIRVIDSSSDIAQVKLAAKLVGESPSVNSQEAHHTAIVLADENLLLPALTSLPANVESINITMGYPLKFSPVYSLIKDLLTLQKNLRSDEKNDIVFDHRDVLNILSNSFFNDKPDNLTSSLIDSLNADKELWISRLFFEGKPPFDFIFSKIQTARELSSYLKKILEKLYILTEESEARESVAVGISIRNEFIYRVILAINRLDTILTDKDIAITVLTFNRLLDRILRGLSIPFSGEPLNGIQIMGILETRSLDFKNLIMLSVNEGVLPQNSAGNSFIPYNLREAFGLPTIRHQDSIYAYYFYRLLQRAENVTLIYNSSADGLKTGEMSRFLIQLKYSEKPPWSGSQRFEIRAPNRVPEEIKRDIVHIEKLRKNYLLGEKKILSPSAVNTWLTCRMKFYYRYVCGLKEPEKVSREIDPAMFGELLHFVMEKVYSPIKKRILSRDVFDSIGKNYNYIDGIIADSINEKFYNMKKSKLSGNDLIICNILKSYIQLIIKHDSTMVPLEIVELEHSLSSELEIEYKGKKDVVRVGGVIDRLDRTGAVYRITDYKTGKTEMEILSVESLFDDSKKDRNDSWFQILMYCSMFLKENEYHLVRPSVYPVRSMFGDDFIDCLRIKDINGQSVLVDDFEKVRESFDFYLQQTIENIFSPDESFRMTEHLKKCDFCPFARLCQR